MVVDRVVRRYRQRFVTHHVTVSSGQRTRGANVNYQIKTNKKAVVKEKCSD